MNYSQFLLMMPEATLVAILIIVFFADLAAPLRTACALFP